MVMVVRKFYFYFARVRIAVFFCAIACLLAIVATAAAAAPNVSETQGRFSYRIGADNFTVTRDAVKLESSENGMFKIMPRIRNSIAWTQFPLPESAWRQKEWVVTAGVSSSVGTGAGVGMWGDDGGYTLVLFPDGRGFMRYYEGKNAVWSAEVKAANFSWPARLSLVRDTNGSVIGRVNGAIVGVRLLGVDLKKRALPMIKSVSFATQASGTDGGYALYESLDVEAWGQENKLTNL
jgi:hypothetical protein